MLPAEASLTGTVRSFDTEVQDRIEAALRDAAAGIALAHGVAAVGFAYGFLSKTLVEAAPFLLVALALNCWHYPRLARLIDRGRTLD